MSKCRPRKSSSLAHIPHSAQLGYIAEASSSTFIWYAQNDAIVHGRSFPLSMMPHKQNEYQPQNWDFDYTSIPIGDLYRLLHTGEIGLTDAEASHRLQIYGPNAPGVQIRYQLLKEISAKFTNPLIILLLTIGTFSLFVNSILTAIVIYSMSAFSIVLPVVQERRARKAAEHLSTLVQTTTTVIRDGVSRDIDLRALVPGDLVSLAAGDIIPGDIRLIKTNNLYVNQSSLTGESMPVEKIAVESPGVKGESPELPQMVFMGAAVVSGTGSGVVIHTGPYSTFGKLAAQLEAKTTTTEFDKELKDFTWLLIRVVIIVVSLILLINVLTKHNFIASLLFALTISVQIGPETLPMTIAINLSKGAFDMAKNKVVVKNHYTIQNFGAMDILCTDKTGTLTMNEVVLQKYLDAEGRESEVVLRLGYLNSYFQTSLKNAMDQAVLEHHEVDISACEKIDEIPFDFTRKLLSVVVREAQTALLIAKGAPEEITKRCSGCQVDGTPVPIERFVTLLRRTFDTMSADGFRVLAVAYKRVENTQHNFTTDDEADLVFMGFMAFLDPPKLSAREAIDAMEKKGISLRIVTGDNELITRKIATEVGLSIDKLLTGAEIEAMSDAELAHAVEQTTIFARVLPLHKERIVRTFRTNNHVVGFLGDGINDTPALKVADIGISVNNAVDIAKESASIILIENDLKVLTEGVLEGRRVFGNFIKYIRMTNSFNVGFMITMTLASIVLPFIPLTPLQILLNNYLYDALQVAVPTDHVDEDYIEKPKVWNTGQIYKFMLLLGPINSMFDIATWIMLIYLFHGLRNAQRFQTGWYLEILCVQILAIYVIRTQRISFLQSHPSKALILSSIILLAIGFIVPYTGLAGIFNLVRMPLTFYGILVLLLIAYLIMLRSVKNWILARYQTD
ncbi:MAG TPA: magnesium-translocating P-type ATPase [Armatimonadota bacterium]|nr:magnesium-translocating P-type ATPase [Armatimonadota bacterium]